MTIYTTSYRKLSPRSVPYSLHRWTLERQHLRRQCGLPSSCLKQNSNIPITVPRSHQSRSRGIKQTHDRARHARRLRPPAEDWIWARLCVRSAEGSVIDDGVFTTLSSTYSFRDLFEIAQTCMGPHAASKAFMDMEITSLDLVEGDLSFPEVQAQGTAHTEAKAPTAYSSSLSSQLLLDTRWSNIRFWGSWALAWPPMPCSDRTPLRLSCRSLCLV